MAVTADCLVREYIEALELSAVCLYGPENGCPTRICSTTDITRRRAELNWATWMPIVSHAVFWFAHKREAEAVAARARQALVTKNLRGEWFDVEAPEAAGAVARAIHDEDVAFEDEDKVKAYAAQVIAAVDEAIASQQSAGELKSINRAYREYRLSTSAAGLRPMSYNTWRDQHRRRMIRATAETARQFARR